MSFESGGEMENPFDDADDEDETSNDVQADDTEDVHMGETTTAADDETKSQPTRDPSTDTSSSSQSPSDASSGLESTGGVDYISELEAGRQHSTDRLARALMEPEYHAESPPVPYATWRDGTSTGRDRTTLELNADVDDLVRKAQAEFEDRYGTNITKADLREFAMVYGLAHLDDVFAMAEEWGVQYDN